jgi:hypothetical protein
MAKDDDNLDLAWGELLVIGSRHHRNQHQDEFGPTRAERMQALRDLLDRVEVLSSRLEALPPQLRLLVSERHTEGRSPAGPINVDPVASYSADKDAIEVVLEIASDVRRDLADAGRTDDANLIGEVWAAADTTDGDVVIDGGSAVSALTDNSADPFDARRSGVCTAGSSLRSSTSGVGKVRKRACHWFCWSHNCAISGNARPAGPSPPIPSSSASTRAAHNRHLDASCAQRSKRCNRAPLGLTNTRQSNPTCAP